MYAALDFAFAISDLGPHPGARVLGVKLGHLLQEFAGALVARVGCGDSHFDNLVAALGGALRNFQQGTAADGRDFNFGAQGGRPYRVRHGDFNIVAFAAEKGMGFHFGGDVEIARDGAHGAGVALAGDAQAGTVARAWRNADFHTFGVGDASIAATTGTGVAQLAAAAASR